MYERTEDGRVINPPVIKSYERDIYQAMSDADTGEIQRLTEEYENDRTTLANKRDDRERKARDEQELKDLELRERLRAEQKASEPAPVPVSDLTEDRESDTE